jgi:flavin-dependent dehydrogenase
VLAGAGPAGSTTARTAAIAARAAEREPRRREPVTGLILPAGNASGEQARDDGARPAATLAMIVRLVHGCNQPEEAT